MTEGEIARRLRAALHEWLYASLVRPRRTLWVEPLLGLERACGFDPPTATIDSLAFAARLSRACAAIPTEETRADAPLPAGQSLASWLKAGGSRYRYRAVARLARIARNHAGLLLRACVHGSVATLDDARGFSDLDTAFIVRRETLTQPGSLLLLRKLATDVLLETLLFDPYMHHGPHWIAEDELSDYPQPRLPAAVFERAVDLVPGPTSVRLRDSEEETQRQLDIFEAFFRQRLGSVPPCTSRYDVEWVVGNALILPVLALQLRTGVFRYKKEAIPLARELFVSRVFDPIERATLARDALRWRPRVPLPVAVIARTLGRPDLVGRLARGALRTPLAVRRVNSILGAEFAARILELIRAIRDLPRPGGGPEPRAATLLRWSPDRPLSDFPQRHDLREYDRASAEAVADWLSRTRPPLSIYRMGSVRAPGFSDLDFVLVYPDRSAVPDLGVGTERLSGPSRELITHAPYVCTVAAFRRIRFWYPVFDLRLLAGAELETHVESPTEVRGVALGHLVDYLLLKVPVDFLRYGWARPTRVRLLSNLLHSFRYTVRLAERAGVPCPPGVRQVVQDVDELRATAIGMAQVELRRRLESAFARTARAAGALMEATAAVLGSAPAGRTGQVAGLAVEFLEDWDADDALCRTYLDQAAGRELRSSVPSQMAHVLAAYALTAPELGAQLAIADGLRPLDGAYADGLRAHARAMALYGVSARRLGVPPQKYVALSYVSRRLDP